jgi:hypothetical protein
MVAWLSNVWGLVFAACECLSTKHRWGELHNFVHFTHTHTLSLSLSPPPSQNDADTKIFLSCYWVYSTCEGHFFIALNGSYLEHNMAIKMKPKSVASDFHLYSKMSDVDDMNYNCDNFYFILSCTAYEVNEFGLEWYCFWLIFGKCWFLMLARKLTALMRLLCISLFSSGTYEVVSKIFWTGAAIYSAVVVVRSTGRW